MNPPPNVRLYGQGPYGVAVVHGGPGAAGEMAPVADRLSRAGFGVLEPLQTKDSVVSQIEELLHQMQAYGEIPYTLIGFSWGAWLSLLAAAREPSHIEKLILISSGSFQTSYVTGLMDTRRQRLSGQENDELTELLYRLTDEHEKERDTVFARLGQLMTKADACDPIDLNESAMSCRFDIFKKVWAEAEALRRSGQLLETATQLQCPVIAIHGDHDPHLAAGVREPLTKAIGDFQFILLPRCGHKPWIEKHSAEDFYRILIQSLARQTGFNSLSAGITNQVVL